MNASAPRRPPCPARALRLLLLGLLLAAAGAARAAEAPAGSRPRLAAVELVLPPGEDRPALEALLGLTPGEPLSVRALRGAVQRLYQVGRFRNVVARAQGVAPPTGQEGDWVRLTVEAEPLRRLSRMTLRWLGPAPLPDDRLREAARLEPGAPFDDDRLEEAEGRIRAALARKGYRAARVEAEARRESEAQVALELSVAPGEPTRIGAVQLEGEAGPSAAAALAALSARPGAVLDEDALSEDARRLRAFLYAAGHRRARVGTPRAEGEDGLFRVRFPVTAGPRMALAFRGQAALPQALLERSLGLDPEAPLEVPALETAAERLRTLYRARGFADARVEVEEVPRARDLTVVFRIHEGRPYLLGPVRFEGVEAHGPAWLRDRLRAHLAEEAERAEAPEGDDRARLLAASVPGVRARPGSPPPLPPGEAYEEASWDRAGEELAEDLRGEGYLESVYLGAALSLDERRRQAAVALRFREGPRTTVEALEVRGNQTVAEAELVRLVRLAPGDGLAYARVEESRAAILRRYAGAGRIFAQVKVEEEVVDRARGTVRLRLLVDEGPEVRVGRLLLAGNRRTRDDLVRGRMALRQGEVYAPEAVARSQAALLDTGVFRSVSLRLQDPEVPQESKDVLVELTERPYASLTQSFGYSIANGPRAQLEYLRPNLLGRALELSLRGKVNYPTNAFGFRPDLAGRKPGDRVEGEVDAGLRTALLPVLPFPAAGRLNLLGEVVHRPAYNLRRASAVTGLDAGITSRSTFSLQYELEVDAIDRTGAVGNLTQADLERLRFDEGTTTLHALRPSFALDHRDNSAHPQSGWLVSGALEYAHSLGQAGRRGLLGLLPGSAIHSNLVKAWGTLSGYLPLGSGAVLALSARAGQVFPLDPASRTIIPRRFFLGGASTLRGFPEEGLIQADVRPALAAEAQACRASTTDPACTDRGLRIAQGKMPVSEGGEAFVLGKAELRLPMAGRLELGLFLDAGNLWLDPRREAPFDLRPSAGLGARFVTPIGPAALDLGFNLDRDGRIEEPVFVPHFTIGLF